MKKIIILFFVIVLLSGCSLWQSSISPDNTNQPLIGGQTDDHGCLIAAGYSWCEPKQKCLRIWEEKCYDTEDDAVAEIFAKKHNQPLEQTSATIVQMEGSYASGTISFGPEPGESGGFLIHMDKGDWVIDYEGNGQVDCAKVRALGYPQAVLAGYCDVLVPLADEEVVKLINRQQYLDQEFRFQGCLEPHTCSGFIASGQKCDLDHLELCCDCLKIGQHCPLVAFDNLPKDKLTAIRQTEQTKYMVEVVGTLTLSSKMRPIDIIASDVKILGECQLEK